MYVKKTYGYVLSREDLERIKGLLDVYNPPTITSQKWKYWAAHLDLKTCLDCRTRHGTIYRIQETPAEMPPIHPNCRCEIKPMETVEAGDGTKDGKSGADWWIKYYGVLPEYYITEEELKQLGWRWGKSPAKFAPGKMVTMGVFENINNHLPEIPGRIWYEADVNYYSGRRTNTVYYGQTTVYSLSPTTIMERLSK